jgi:hypothetical protein
VLIDRFAPSGWTASVMEERRKRDSSLIPGVAACPAADAGHGQ